MEDISVWAADNDIDKDLWSWKMYPILYEDDNLESLKLELLQVIQRSQGLSFE